MKRRDLLKAGLAGAFSLATPLAAGPAFELPAGSFCRAPRTGVIKVKRGGNDLAYQGTHILTYGALEAISKAYQGPDGGQLLVTGGGCDDGIAAVRSGRADLGGLCCPVEGTRAEGMPWRQVAWDIKVIVTHPTIPLDSLPSEALGALAKGKISNWNQLDGETRPIALVVRRHCQDKLEPVRELLLDGRPEWSPRALWVETDQQLVDTVSRFPGAIGFVSRVFAQPLITSGRLKALNVDGIAPERKEVEAGRYGLKGPLNLVYRAWDDANMRPFFEFLASSDGRAISGRHLVPVDSGVQHRNEMVRT